MRGVRGPIAAAVLSATVVVTAGAAEAKLNVVATIKPIHSLVAKLMDGIGTPTLLVEGAASPHTFALKPSGVRAINAADVFIRVSGDLEPFTRKIVTALPDRVRVVTLANAPGVRLLKRRRSGMFEGHVHKGGEEGVSAGETHDVDGHIWLDPDNAKAIVSYLAQVLSARDPAHADKLKANARRLNSEIDALTADIAAATKPLKGKPFVVFHDAYQYFETRFGLDALGSITASPEIQPSAKRLTELRRKLRALKAVCVFAEPLYQPNLIAAVTEGTDARSGTLDPAGTTLAPGPDLYFALMHNLATGFKSCLEPPS